jgi:hypothetical protein
MLLWDISQILTAIGTISTSQEEQILTNNRKYIYISGIQTRERVHENIKKKTHKPSLIILSNLQRISKNHGPHSMKSRYWSQRSKNFWHVCHIIPYEFKREINKKIYMA